MQFTVVLPENVCSGLAQLVESAIAAPAEAASDAIIQSKISALRCCLDDAVSRVLAARNAKRLILPDDIWPLVLEHLPLDDLLSASRTCHSWRALSLAHSRLWTRLILRVDECGPDRYLTNTGLLINILPRARNHTLELDVRIAIPWAFTGYDLDVRAFLDRVAPRLVRLNFASVAPWVVCPVLNEYFTVFPELRELTVPPPPGGCSGSDKDCYLVELYGKCMPKLVALDLHADLRLYCEGSWAELQTLHCKCEGITLIESLLVSAGGLQRLICDWTFDMFDDARRPGTALLAALRAIPDVHITAELAPIFEDVVFDIFGCSPAPRVNLSFNIHDEYDDQEYDDPFRPRPCSRLLSAILLTISVRGDAVVIIPDDGSDRETLISLRAVPPTNTLHPAIDWSLISSFEALVHLSAHAVLWPDFMHNFPICPRLAGITLAVRAASDIPPVLAASALPQAESLDIVLESAVEVLAEQVDALKTAFGARHVALNGAVTKSSEAFGQ